MKTNSLTKILSVAAFAAILTVSSSVFAQVKIGTNPTTIGANNNLEVEGSTTGRKTSIDKATGQVTIQDGTQGAGKVLTSDANGASSWQTATGPSVLNPEVLLSVQTTTAVYNPSTITIAYTSKNFDRGNNFSLPSTFTAPSDGIYLVTITVGSAPISATNNGRYVTLRVTGSSNYSLQMINTGVAVNDGEVSTGTRFLALKAGDQITTYATAVNFAYTQTSASFEIMKISNL